MKKNKNNIIIIFIIIIIGLITRDINIIPYFIGDILRGAMIYFIIKLFFINNKIALILSLIICFGIEFSQLIDLYLLNHLRSYSFGKLILGQGFLFSDLISYSVGILTAYCSSKINILKTKSSS